MLVDLRYGRGALSVELPASLSVTVLRKPAMPVLDPPAGAVARALATPVAARALAEEARGQPSACVLICDVTRPVPNGLLLGPVVRELLSAGLPAGRITVLVATGLHRPNLGAELAELVGDPWVLRTVAVVNHDARDDAAHADLGTTPDGTPIRIDRRFAEAGLKLVTGLVEPHFMAGYSGGRKVIAPGIAHQETIATFHSSRFMAHPRAESCVLDGNPLHREQLCIAARLGRVLAVNTALDEERRLAFVNYGEVLQSHAEAVAFVERYARLPVARRFRTVVTSAAGYPLDKTYYQTVKGMVAPLAVLEPGGTLIVASECSEGLGSPDYARAQARLVALGPERFLAELAGKRLAEVDEWQAQMLTRATRVGRVQLCCRGMSAADRALTGVEVIDSIEDAVMASVQRSGDPAVAVIPEGPYVVPVLG